MRNARNRNHLECICLSGHRLLCPASNRIRATYRLLDLDEDHAELCPNEKMVDVNRLSNVHGCAGLDKSFQS
jgi:hypothetical protein